MDPRPTFLFIDRGAAPPRGATAYDLPAAALGHRGDRVTFDALLERYPREDAGLRQLAELVRDIDLGRFRRPESRGLETLLYGLLLVEPDDRTLLRQTDRVFEAYYRYFCAETER